MDRTIWSDGVEVSQTQLANEHDALATNILQRWTDGAQMGVASGLEVTVNGTDARRVDIAAGHGYVPTGDLAELTAARASVALKLYDGSANYVCLVYTETASRPAAHETSGTARNTRASRAVDVVVYSQAELDALPAASVLSVDGSVDFTVPARDRVLVCAIVRAASPTGLVATNITSPPTRGRILSIVQPSEMTGVEVIDIDSTTETTAERLAAGDTPATKAAGQLKMILTFGTFPAASTSITLAYKAPGDTVFGTPKDLLALASPQTLTSTNGHTVRVRWVDALLPVGGNATSPWTITETLTVTDVFEDVPAYTSSRDEQLRHLGHTVTPTVPNPLGLKLSDLGAGLQELMGSLSLGTGLMTKVAQLLAPRLYSEVPFLPSGATNTQRVLLWDIPILDATPPVHIRVYGGGVTVRGLEFAINARWADNANGTGRWVADVTTSPAGLFALGRTVVPDASFDFFGKASTATAWTDADWVSVIMGGALTAAVTIPQQVVLGSANLTTDAGIHTARVLAPYSTTLGRKYTLMWGSAPASGAYPSLRLYVSQLTATTFRFNLTWNAAWNQAGDSGNGTWVADQAAYQSTLFTVQVGATDSILAHYYKAASSGSWTEAAWTALLGSTANSFTVNGVANVTGNLAVSGDLIVDYTQDALYSAPRTFQRAVMGAAGLSFFDSSGGAPDGTRWDKTTQSTGDGQVVYPFSVPDGATLTGASVWIDLTLNATPSLTIEGRRNDTNGTSSLLGTALVRTTDTSGVEVLSVVFDTNNVVDNSLYSYGLRLFSTSGTNAEIAIYTVNWTYTSTYVADKPA